MSAPKPAARPGDVSLWRYLRLFREDILSAQPEKLYRAKMAEFRTPFFRSFLVNEPGLVRRVLQKEPDHFPKSDRVTVGLRPLLGNSVFVTNGAAWRRQRRIIDPAFGGGRLKTIYPDILSAAEAAVARIEDGEVDVEAMTSHAAADVIFRTLFSVPIEDEMATRTYVAFRTFQRVQPIMTPSALVRWWPRAVPRTARDAAGRIRSSIAALVDARRALIDRGAVPPDDLATALMTTPDPETGEVFTRDEVIDQVAIFFLAGHETSAAALAWALWLIADDPQRQGRVRTEARGFLADPGFSRLSSLTYIRDVVRETLRLYPPVPMMVREAASPAEFRGRKIAVGDQVVVSPWHMHRHEDHWSDPDAFRPERWRGRPPTPGTYIPFSAGPRVCPGAGFAMSEAVLMLAILTLGFDWKTAGDRPVPVAHLTVRSRDGITLTARRLERL